MRALLLGLLVCSAALADPQIPVFTATPAVGVTPVTTTLAWQVTGADTCTASGAWSGSQPVTGTQVVAGLTASSVFTLTCGSAAGDAVLTWTAPTQNEDGTPLTNLAGYKVRYGQSPGALSQEVIVPAATTLGITIPGLTVATWYFTVASYTDTGVESAPTGAVSKTVVLPAVADTVSVTVNPQPEPTVPVTVSQVAYELRQYANGTLRFVFVGVVPLGRPCGLKLVGSYAVITGVTFTVPLQGGIIAGRCN